MHIYNTGHVYTKFGACKCFYFYYTIITIITDNASHFWNILTIKSQ